MKTFNLACVLALPGLMVPLPLSSKLSGIKNGQEYFIMIIKWQVVRVCNHLKEHIAFNGNKNLKI